MPPRRPVQCRLHSTSYRGPAIPLSDTLADFVPTDPGYAPFGWGMLRGLNMLPVALVLWIATVWSLETIAQTLAFSGWPRKAAPWQELAGLLGAQSARFGVIVAAFLPMLALLVSAVNRTVAHARVWQTIALALAVIGGSLAFSLVWRAGTCALGTVEGSAQTCERLSLTWWWGASVFRAALWGGLVALLLAAQRRDNASSRALLGSRLARLNARRQETEARLQSLQAQVEPHFLFNTLAHIDRLLQMDRPQGRSMLRSLTGYLRAALPLMRERDSTLERELALTRSYLEVQRIRMGDRLQAEIDMPPELAGVQVPPMMVLTLAENSVKHGLGQKREGGTLRIACCAKADRLEVTVEDDGAGLKIGGGGGRGLANVRARLTAMHGPAAELDICNREGGGAIARLTMPLQFSLRAADGA